MKNKISINDFTFKFSGYGQYNVTYTSPKTGKSFNKHITDMEIIDSTKNAENAKIKDLNLLKRIIKC